MPLNHGFTMTGDEYLSQQMPDLFGPDADHFCQYREHCRWAMKRLLQELITAHVRGAYKFPLLSPHLAYFTSDDSTEYRSWESIAVFSDDDDKPPDVVSDPTPIVISDSEESELDNKESGGASAPEESSSESDDDSKMVLEATRGNVSFSTS